MKLVLIIAIVMSDNYVKFQSSVLNGYWEKENLPVNKNTLWNVDARQVPAHLPTYPMTYPNLITMVFQRKPWLKFVLFSAH
jgi:hypothetical protein